MKFGLIGCGYWGQKCIRVLQSIKNCDLALIADTDPVKLKPYQEQGCQVTNEYRDILKDDSIAGVFVLTPATSHYSIIKDCFQANKHVFVEKPLTASSAQAEELVLLAESKKLKLMVGHIYLFNPAIKLIKQIIDQRELKPPLHFNFQRRGFGPIRQDVNVLWDLGPHEVSIMLYLTGLKPTEVLASGVNILGNNQLDIVTADLKFGKDFSASMIFSWVNPVKIRDLTITSREKMLVFSDLATEKIKIFNVGKDQISTIAMPVPDKEPLYEELNHFVYCLEDGKEPLITGRDGLAVIKILEEIEKNIKK